MQKRQETEEAKFTKEVMAQGYNDLDGFKTIFNSFGAGFGSKGYEGYKDLKAKQSRLEKLNKVLNGEQVVLSTIAAP